jgi:hypothetical protein
MRVPVNKYPKELTKGPINNNLESLYASKVEVPNEVLSATQGLLGRAGLTKKANLDVRTEIGVDDSEEIDVESHYDEEVTDESDTSSDGHEEEGELQLQLIALIRIAILPPFSSDPPPVYDPSRQCFRDSKLRI